MAKDTLELIDNVGWTALRQLHVIGVSMGGMIAQELVRMSWAKAEKHVVLTSEIGYDGPRQDSVVVSSVDRSKVSSSSFQLATISEHHPSNQQHEP